MPDNLSCMTMTLPPFETTSSSLALPLHTSLNASMRTPSWHMTLSLATLSLHTIPVQSQMEDGRQSHTTLAPWSFSGGPTMVHITLCSWMVQCPSYGMLHSILSPILPAHNCPYQSCTYLTVMTSPRWLMTLLTMMLMKTKMRLNQGQLRF
jgi:hypothetical protein